MKMRAMMSVSSYGGAVGLPMVLEVGTSNFPNFRDSQTDRGEWPLPVDLGHRVAQGFVGDSHEAAVGIAQLKNKENRARDRERAHQQRHGDGCIEAREETEAEKQYADPKTSTVKHGHEIDPPSCSNISRRDCVMLSDSCTARLCIIRSASVFRREA